VLKFKCKIPAPNGVQVTVNVLETNNNIKKSGQPHTLEEGATSEVSPNGKLVGSQTCSGHFVEQKNLCC